MSTPKKNTTLWVVIGITIIGLLISLYVVYTKRSVETKDSNDGINLLEMLPTEKTYICEDYFGSRLEIVYDSDNLISVKDTTNSTNIDDEKKLLEEDYNGNIEDYLTVVRSFCND